MININKLKACIVENEMNNQKTAKSLGISVNAFSRKLNGKAVFTLDEVESLCKMLNIKNPCEIFLPEISRTCNDKQLSN